MTAIVPSGAAIVQSGAAIPDGSIAESDARLSAAGTPALFGRLAPDRRDRGWLMRRVLLASDLAALVIAGFVAYVALGRARRSSR